MTSCDKKLHDLEQSKSIHDPYFDNMYSLDRQKLKNLLYYNHNYLNEDHAASLAGYMFGPRFPTAGLKPNFDPHERRNNSKNVYNVNRARSKLPIDPAKYADSWMDKGLVLTYNGFYKRKPCDLQIRLDDE